MIKINITVFIMALMMSSVSFANQKVAFVHLFEWSWQDIAVECEKNLGPKGFSAVQVSPPQLSDPGPEWWRRYQPVSYEIEGRSGNIIQFINMVKRCEVAGVDIYVDAVINHMAAYERNFPLVPYTPLDFHDCREDIDYKNKWQVHNCDLVGLNDLATETDYVRQTIADYLNRLIEIGVKGFRFDAAKHMPPEDVQAIIDKLKGNPYIFLEVIRGNDEAVQPEDYKGIADITEFNFTNTTGHFFKGRGPLKELRNIGIWNGWLPSADAITFVSNHDTQRQAADNTLSYKDIGDLYYIAEIFMLAYPYGYPKVMSSYYFETENQGPPAMGPNSGDNCFSGEGSWVCEHRWRGIANMVEFRRVTGGSSAMTEWWDNGNHQIAFGRDGKGFVAINREDSNTLSMSLQTGMPEGVYCDIINGEYDKKTRQCSGSVVTVNANGYAMFNVKPIGASAIHLRAKVDIVDCDDDCDNTVNVQFTCLNGITNNGQSVYVVGNIAELGNWQPESAVKLDAQSYPIWIGEINVPKRDGIEWKCIKRHETNVTEGIEWQSGSNNQLSSTTEIMSTASF